MPSETPDSIENRNSGFEIDVLFIKDAEPLIALINEAYRKKDNNLSMSNGERRMLTTFQMTASPTRAVLEGKKVDGFMLTAPELAFLATHRATQDVRYANLIAKEVSGEELSPTEKAEINRFRLSSVIQYQY